MSHNIQKRGSVYYFRRRIPNDLLDHYEGKREIVRSLGVKDRAEATMRARKVSVDLDDEWQRLRSTPQRPDNVLTAAELEAWERARLEAEEEGAEQEKLEEWAEEEAEEMANHLARAIRILERQRAEAGAPPLDPVIRAVIAPQLSIAPVGAELPSAGCMPAAAAPSGRAVKAESTVSGHTLSSLIPVWKRERKPAEKTLQSAAKAVDEMGDPDVSTMRRQTIIAYRDRLLEEGKATKTINTRLSFIRILLGVAKDRGYVEVNHADDTALAEDKRAVELRAPYQPNQIQAVISATEGMKESLPAMYWLPRLARWTGARLNELHQLRKRDVQVREGVPGLMITDEGDSGQGVPMRLKNAGSRRWVPLAAPVREFAEWVSERPDGPLFPAKPNKYGIISDAFSKRYGRFLRDSLKLNDDLVTFHSWRHTFADMCRDAGVEPEVRMALMGHTEGGAAGTYGSGNGLHPRRLIEAINRLSA